MADNRGTNDTSNQNNRYESYGDYLKRAAGACEAGDRVLGMHLYLAAYERAVADPDIPDGMALSGLREAWNLACDLKERSMAEYVFEKLEPFLTGEEIALCASKLQNLALDRLEEYGFSREELQGMADLISRDIGNGDGSIVKVESISLPKVAANLAAEAIGAVCSAGDTETTPGADESELAHGAEVDSAEDADTALNDTRDDEPASVARGLSAAEGKKKDKPEHVGMGSAPADFNPYDYYNTSSVGTSYHASTNEGAGSYVFTRDKQRETELERARAEAERENATDSGQEESAAQAADAGTSAETQANGGERSAQQGEKAGETNNAAASATVPPKLNAADLPSLPQVAMPGGRALSYDSLAGYGSTVTAMRQLGIGLERDGGFRNFIDMMNSRHGLDRMPALDTLLFRAPVIEDATRFVDATIGEIGLPVLRMSMEEGFQGAPLLCVTTYGDSRPRMNHAQNRFDGPAILVLDDLDMWTMPQFPENPEGIAGFVMANMSRGAREAMSMIRSAVEDPDVYVLATASEHGEVEPFFCDILEPISFIDIANPTEGERDEIWHEIMHNHPSMRALDRKTLVKYSAGMPRYDVYMAARAAVEEAYKTGLVQRMYLPVTMQNVLDKIAAYQPLDSHEYQAIEDEIIRGFHEELDNLEDLFGGFSE